MKEYKSATKYRWAEPSLFDQQVRGALIDRFLCSCGYKTTWFELPSEVPNTVVARVLGDPAALVLHSAEYS